MTPFLKQVARHYYRSGMIEQCCFILPNKRARVFLNKYICEEVAAISSKPVLAPESITIDDFFHRLTGSIRTDRTRLLIELYGVYASLNSEAESLDEFIFWGDALLGDFDDVDKYLVDASQIFRNISELKDMQDDMSYLSDTQREAISRLIGHFREHSQDESSPKARFLKIWNILLPLYERFNEVLREKGLSYEGQVYRELSERLSDESVTDILADSFKGTSRFVFVGLNALNNCEKTVMRKMRNAGVAEFCWDYVSDMIKDADNKASFFMKENVVEFPQAFELEALGGETVFNTLQVSSGIGQAKEIPELLKMVRPGKSAGIETAIVLADESLLLPVLNSIPENTDCLNVTMGYPLKSSATWDLLTSLSTLQLHTRESNGKLMFYYKSVYEVFSNSLVRTAGGEEAMHIIAKIRGEKKYYIPQEDFAGNRLFELIFRAAVSDPLKAQPIDGIAEYQKSVINALALGILECGKDEAQDMVLELDFCKSLIQTISRIQQCELSIKAATYFRLLMQLASGCSVPFTGEPLKGLQIMGPLETRDLDFENVIILSCNEGMFPRRSVSSSFIPAEVRKGFDLPTYEYQDAVWAYYFYRLIQRARNVWMVYDSRKGGLKGGEESRYIRQLKMHFGCTVNEHAASVQINSSKEEDSIAKTEEHIATVKRRELSASALINYLSCPAKFYYHSVENLCEEDEISESLDARLTGDVFHKVMCRLYKGRKSISIKDLESMRRDTAGIRQITDSLIIENLKCSEVSGRNIIFAEMICEYVCKALERDMEMLKSLGSGSMDILKLEEPLRAEMLGFRFKGILDRLDSPVSGSIRVVDYKTGKVDDKELLIDESNRDDVLSAIRCEKDSDRAKVAFQMYIYDKLLEHEEYAHGKKMYNSIYQCSRLFTDSIVLAPVDPVFVSGMDLKLKEILDEISDLGRNWERTAVRVNCDNCPFKNLCAR